MKMLPLFAAVLSAFALAFPVAAGLPEIAEDGTFALKGARFEIMAYQNWQPTFQNRKSLQVTEGHPLRTATTWLSQGVWRLRNDISYRFREELSEISPDSFGFLCTLATEKHDNAYIVLNGQFPASQLSGRSCRFDDREVALPKNPGDFKELKLKNIQRAVFHTASGDLAIDNVGNIDLFAGNNAYRIRIAPRRKRLGMAETLTFDLKFATAPGGAAAAIRKAWATPPARHPRLLFADFAALRRTDVSPLHDKMRRRIIAEADKILPTSPEPPKMQDPMRMLYHCQHVLSKLNFLAMAYAFTGKPEYAARGVAEMLAVAAYKDWNPRHYLDTAELALGMAVAYDTLYPAISPADRRTISRAIIEKGIRPSFLPVRENWWISVNNNWNAVCHTGMLAAAIAVAEDDPELAAATVARAVDNMGHFMRLSYSPNGAFPEGPGYWLYSSDVVALSMDILERNFPDLMGLDKIPGMSRTGDYIQANTGPTGLLFNCGDAHTFARLSLSYAMFSFGRRYRRPDYVRPDGLALLNAQLDSPKTIDANAHRLFALFYNVLPEETGGAAPAAAPLHYFSGENSLAPLAVIRSGGDRDAAYAAMTLGKPARNHGHMDCGSFVLDLNGERWAMDLGAQNYSKAEKHVTLWDPKQNSTRWSLFRYGASSHNIPRIDNAAPDVNATGKFSEISPSAMTADLSAAYRGQAERVSRRITVAADRTIEITDSFTGLKPGAAVTFQLCTQSSPEAEAAPDTLLLHKNNRTVRIANSAAAAWEAVDEARMLQPYDQATGKVKMLRFTVPEKSGAATYTVTVRPVK